jgi:hypothetical protein
LADAMRPASNPEIESSPLSGPVVQDGTEIYVEIYRIAPRNEGWTLEVIDHEGRSTVWDASFETDVRAHRIFLLALQLEGIRSFVEAPVSNDLSLRLRGQSLSEQ